MKVNGGRGEGVREGAVLSGFARDLAEGLAGRGERGPAVVGAVKGQGFHKSTLSRWARGEQGVGVVNALRLQAALEAAGITVPLEYFYGAVS